MYQKQDVPPDFFDHFPAMTQCANCDGLVPRAEAVEVVRHITEVTREAEHYCSEACAAAWREVFHAYD